MWIEYDLRFEQEVWDRGMFNSDQIKLISIQQHGNNYGEALDMYFEGYDMKCLFIINDKEVMDKVWHALKNAIAGVPSSIAGVGYIRPLQRPFLNESTLIPSAYESTTND